MASISDPKQHVTEDDDDDHHHHSSAAYFAHPLNARSQILRRTHLVAPVTAVSVVAGCNRILIGKGSELESRPLRSAEKSDAVEVGKKHERSNEVGDETCRGGGIGDEAVYQHRAFAACDGSGVIHGMRYARLKSTTTSADDCAVATSSDGDADYKPTPVGGTDLLPHWSRTMAVFGERKLSVLCGGGIGVGQSDSPSDPIVPLYFAPKQSKPEPDDDIDGYDHRYLQSCLTLTDLIYDVRLLIVPRHNDGDPSDDQPSLLAAIGMAQNVVEIWSMAAHATPSRGTIPSRIVLTPRRIRKVVCEVRCITYSLSLYGWGGGRWIGTGADNHCGDTAVQDLDLAVAVGTPSSIIYVWNALTKEDGEGVIADAAQTDAPGLSIVTKPTSHTLSGHDGVVFSCRFGYNGQYLASTGDDRTVRLWKRDAGDADCKVPVTALANYESALEAKAIVHPRYRYELLWTTYGHTARVWDCAFAPSLGMLVTCGEDSTVRMWDIVNGGRSVATMKGFNCLNAWSIDVDATEGIASAGGNDGSAKIWPLISQIALNSDLGDDPASSPESSPGMHRFLLPREAKQDAHEAVDESTENANKEEGLSDEDSGKKKKKRKKKPKARNSAQNIVGMTFYAYGEGDGRLLVVARSGKLHSLDLASGAWDKKMTWSGYNPQPSAAMATVDPKSASCIALRPDDDSVAIGMSRGDIAIVTLFNDSDSCDQISFSTAPHIALQAIKWIDRYNLVTLHVKGIAIWWEFHSSSSSAPPKKLAVFDMGTVGVPISLAYDVVTKRLAIGDSRSNVALFDMAICCEENADNKHSPLHLTRSLHGREHVNDLMFSADGSKLISGGNDGCIAECIVSTAADGSVSMYKGISVPVPALTGVMRLWQGPSGNLLAGGYQSNNYVVLDVTQGCQIMNVNTGGRQRSTTLDVQFSARNAIAALSGHLLAICVGRTDDETELLVHSSGHLSNVQHVESRHSPGYYTGLSLHGEFVNGVSWIPTEDPDTSLLLSGSNDSAVKLSCYRNGVLLSTKDLPTHVSCVRAVCASSHSKSSSCLLVTCGAKLITSFYLLEEGSHRGSRGHSDPKISKLCQNRLGNSISMDHRMNAVKSVPLANADASEKYDFRHAVLAGDSDGGLHLFVVSERLEQPKTIAAHMLSTDSRPILCLDIVRISGEWLVACVGDTSGQVSLWLLPGTIRQTPASTSKPATACGDYLSGELPTSPFFTYTAHQCGTNCISALLEIGSPAEHMAGAGSTLLICSGGDDEAISLWSGVLSLVCANDDSHELSVTRSNLIRRNQASSSALKGIKLVGSKVAGYRIYAAGYDQRIALWSIETKSVEERGLVFRSSTPVDISDINCLDAMIIHPHKGGKMDQISIGGEGLEILSSDPSLSEAARALRGANYILITCGAGMSADSGLSTYECMPEEYREICDPSMLVTDTARFQNVWRSFTSTYSETKPHSGYEILDRWCSQGKLQNLCGDEGIGSPCWVYSSNVDGHFRRCSSFGNCVCEIHGFGGQWRCAGAIGQDQGSNRKGRIWEEWNSSRSTKKQCSSTTFSIDKDAADEVIGCKHCGRPARPNVLLFHDTDENVLRDISQQRERYQEWEARVEDEVVSNGKTLVILELGCGLNVPAVREESEEVFSDCLKRIKSAHSERSGVVKLIRINPRDAGVSVRGDGAERHSISIYTRAEEALNQIDALL